MYIDLLQIQRFSFLKFLQNGINQVFDNINPIIIANRKYVFFSKYYLLKIPSQIDFISTNNQLESKYNYSFNTFSYNEQKFKQFKNYSKSHIKNTIPKFFFENFLTFKKLTNPINGSLFSYKTMAEHLSHAIGQHKKIKMVKDHWRITNKIETKNMLRRWPVISRLEGDQWSILKKMDISSTNLTKTFQLTYSSEFYSPVQILDQISKKMYLRWLLLVDLPIQTKRGHFIINGYPKTVIHQIVRSPGIRFKNEDNQILADIISMRGAWMGIQIVYEKNIKAATFKSQNKITNKSTFQRNFSKLNNNFISINEKKNISNVNKQNTRSNLPEKFFFQPSCYKYQAQFIQNPIIKSEKIDHLPHPTLNLLQAKYENKALKKLRYWPRAFFYFQPAYFFQNNNRLALFNKSKKLSIQEIFDKPVRYSNKNQFGLIKHDFWHCPFWSAIRC